MANNESSKLKLARALWLGEQHDQSLRLFSECLKDQPENPLVLTDAARAFGQWFDFDRMEGLIQRLLRLPHDQVTNRLRAGTTYRINYRFDRSQELLEEAATEPQTAVLANLELASLRLRLGDLAGSAAACDNVLKLHPACPEANLLLASVAIRRKDYVESEKQIKKVIRHSQVAAISPDTLSHALCVRARISEHQRDFKSAMKYAENAKVALRPLRGDLEEKHARQGKEVTQLFDKLTNLHFQDHDSERGGNLCLIASYPRSGTTLIEAMLGRNAGVLAADEFAVFSMRISRQLFRLLGAKGPEEVHAKLLRVPAVDLETLAQIYFKCFEQVLDCSLEKRILIDKNPSLLVFLPFYFRLFPRMKVIVPLRDPRDVILSCFFQYLPLNPVSIAYQKLASAARNYAKVMNHWLHVRPLIPDDQYLEVYYEKLVEQPESELSRIREFLGLASTCTDDETTLVIHNAPTFTEANAKPYKSAAGRWKNYPKQMGKLRADLESIMSALEYPW